MTKGSKCHFLRYKRRRWFLRWNMMLHNKVKCMFHLHIIQIYSNHIFRWIIFICLLRVNYKIIITLISTWVYEVETEPLNIPITWRLILRKLLFHTIGMKTFLFLFLVRSVCKLFTSFISCRFSCFDVCSKKFWYSSCSQMTFKHHRILGKQHGFTVWDVDYFVVHTIYRRPWF